MFARNLAQLDAAEKDPRRRLERFIQLFQATTIGCDNRMCLGAMLAVEQESLPDAVRSDEDSRSLALLMPEALEDREK